MKNVENVDPKMSSIKKAVKYVLTAEAVSVVKLNENLVGHKIQYDLAIKALSGKEGPERDLAIAYLELVNVYSSLSIEYITVFKEFNKTLAENEFMLKQVNEVNQ